MNVSDGNGSGQDFDLNIAPIIDAFMVLIAFLLASSAFLSIGIFDAGIAATSSGKQTALKVQVGIELLKENTIRIRLSGKSNRRYQLKANQGERNYDLLTKRLQEIKKKWSSVESVTLSANNQVQYREVIKAMEVTRKVIPAVVLGGF